MIGADITSPMGFLAGPPAKTASRVEGENLVDGLYGLLGLLSFFFLLLSSTGEDMT